MNRLGVSFHVALFSSSALRYVAEGCAGTSAIERLLQWQLVTNDQSVELNYPPTAAHLITAAGESYSTVRVY